ncbi:MAG: chitobiase/beta-hexosaminidase C-terminal domain-containing protein [Bacteroidales bacterium]|nr:chitobiase/beta-hexosaminidase C-terminal domain-containing protein [Bacteroidales bacterium]
MKKYLAIALFLVPFLLTAQQKPAFEKKIYVSSEGKIYVNKDLPVYLWLSTSPDETSNKYRLKSEVTAKYSNPMYFDTEGYNTFRSPSAVDPETRKTILPQQDVVFEVYADSKSPETTISFGESVPLKQNNKIYIKQNTQLSISANDAMSGVESVYYSIDGSEYNKYNQPVTFSQEKEYNIKFFSVDNTGNDENIHEIILVYDMSSPVTTRTVSGDVHENVLSARSKIELKAEDKGIGVSKIMYKLNENKESTYQYPVNAANLAQGEHTLTYYAIDKTGNHESPQTYTFYVDKTPPTIIEEVIAKTFFANGKEYASGKAQLKLTAFDNKAGIKEIRYRINNGEYQLYEKPVFLSGTSGNLQIESFATDNVNNKSIAQAANQKTAVPFIDLSGPSLKYSFNGPVFNTRDTIFISNKTTISLKATDPDAGISRIEYRIDDKETLIYEKPFNINEEGVHTIHYTGYDNVENSSSDKFFVKVDNTGPAIRYDFSIAPIGRQGSANVYPKYVVLFLSGTDSQTGLNNMKYSLGNASPALYSVPVTGFSTGDKTIKVVATDKLGNSTDETIQFHIKD